MSNDEGVVQKRRETEKVRFDRKGRMEYALQTPGTWFDELTPAFGLRVSPKLHRAWIYRMRDADGKPCPGTIPFNSAIDVADYKATLLEYERALAEFKRRKADAALTKDERARKIAKDAEEKLRLTTLEGVFDEFLRMRITRRRKTPLAAQTKALYRQRFDRYLLHTTFDGLPVGQLVLAETKAATWRDVFHAMAVHNINRRLRKSKGIKETPSKEGQANGFMLSSKEELLEDVPLIDTHTVQAMNIVSAIYDYLVGGEILNSNPIDRVRQHWGVRAPERKTRHIASIDLPAFWRGLHERRRIKQARDATHLMMLTGFRQSAARRMRWQQLDLDLGVYHVQPGDVGWKGFVGMIPLSDPVLELLTAIKSGVNRYFDEEWVFPASRANAPYLQSVRGTVDACCKYMKMRISPQDLRRGFSTAANVATHGDVTKVGALMGHAWAADREGNAITEGQITIGYIQNELLALRRAANRTASLILEMAGARPLSDDNRRLLEREGLDIHHLVLADVPDDDEEPEDRE